MSFDGRYGAAFAGKLVACVALLGAGTTGLLTTAPAAQAGPTVTPTLSIFAGTLGSMGPSSDGTATATTLDGPSGLTFDAQGNLLIGEVDSGEISQVDSTGILTHLTGTCEPFGLAVLDEHHILVADDCQDGLGEVSQSGMSWNPSIVNGTDSVTEPTAVAVDSQGDAYVDDGWSDAPNDISKVTPSGSLVVIAGDGSAGSTTPGPATATHLREPAALATDAQGDVYIADMGSDTVDKVTPTGTLSIVAGNVNGATPATKYNLSSPDGVAVDSGGDVFISDSGHGDVVRVTPSGGISVVVGTGTPGTPIPGAAATSSPLSDPGNLAIDRDGNLYIADNNWSTVSVIEKVIDVAGPPTPTPAAPTVSGRTLRCSWSAVGGATSYTVTVYVDGVALPAVTGITATNYTFASTIPGKAYTFTVTAIGDGGTSGTSAPSTAVVAPAAQNPAPVPTGGAVAATLDGAGYWALAPFGQLSDHGNATNYGSENTAKLNAPVVAVNSTTTGHGYWLVASDGGVFTFGDAGFHGSLGDVHLNQPIVAVARTEDNGGYWLAAADGGVFTFGDAHFYGSLGGVHLNEPIVGIAATPDNGGYWLVGADGGIFAFGDAHFYGSLGSVHLNEPIVGIAATPDGHGYWLVGADGGVFTFGQARFFGSLGATGATPINGIIANADLGYRLITPQGTAHPFGNA